MPSQPENPTSAELEKSKTARAQKEKQIKRLADEAAAKARKTEKRYDEQHGTFPRSGPSGMA